MADARKIVGDTFEGEFRRSVENLRKVLEAAGIVTRQVAGRVHTLALRPEALAGALDWISIYRNFWTRRLDALDELLSTDEPRPPLEE